MKYDLLLETYRIEQVKVLSVWSEFKDEDLPVRPRQGDPRGRCVHEQMVLAALQEKDERWWEEPTKFFDVERSRAWVMTRRLTHTSHHRGQQMAMLRMLGRDLHSNYGPTADTGGLMQNHAPTIYQRRKGLTREPRKPRRTVSPLSDTARRARSTVY